MALNFGKGQRAIAFAPATAFPLDARSYFESYDLAVEAAAIAAEPGTLAAENTVYYFGETLVVNEGGKATLYIIQPDKTLKEVGSVPVGDGKSIEVVNGQIKLKGFGSGYYQYNTNYVPGSTEEGKKDQYVFVEEGFKAGLQPQVVAKASGEGFEIAWYEPNPTTVEGLQSQITALDGSVNNLANKVDTKADASSLALYQTQAIPSIEGYASASTVEGALAEVMSQAMSNAGGITAVEGRVGKAEASINAMQHVLNAVSGTYATKEEVNALSTVYETIDNVSSKLANYYTSAQTDAKFETIANVGAKLSNYYTKEQADKKHEEVVKVAEGKTNTYILSYNETIETLKEKLKISDEQKVYDADGNDITAGIKNGDYDDYYIVNNIFNSNSEVVYGVAGYFITFNNLLMGHADEVYGSSYVILPLPHMAEKLKAGDILYITEVDVPDRWYAGGTAPAMFYKMETSKVDLEPYAKTEYVDKAVGGINDSLASYATISYVDEKVAAEASARVSKDNELDAAIKAEVSRATAAESSLRTDVDHLLSQAVLSVSNYEDGNMHLSIENNVLTASVLVSHLELNAQGNLESWAGAVDSTLSDHESRISALEAKPFDTYASISYVEGEVSKLDAAIKAEASRATGAEASLATRLELVEDSLGLGGEGDHGGVAEQIATIIGEVWGANASAENLAEASSRIDDNAGRIGVIEDKVTNTLATKEYVKEQIQSAEHVISVKTDDTDFFEITKDQDDIVTINVKDDIENIIASAVTTVVSGGQYVSAIISSHGLTIDDSQLVSVIDELASNPVVSVAVNNENLEVKHHNDDTVSYNLIKAVFGVESIAPNAASLVNSVEIVSALDDLGHNHEAIKSTVQKAVTSVQTSTLVMSHSGNNLTINLPSVIWLDGGSASDTYEAEVAENNLFEE